MSRGPLPLLSVGFRPFFILGALFAILSMPVWLLIHGGGMTLESHLGPVGWHGHEMVFGFTMAIIAGFLLTAVRNWTREPTASGGPLLALCLVWLAGRLGNLMAGSLPTGLVVTLDVAFPVLLGVAIGIPIFKSRNKRNAAFPFLMLLVAVASLLHHLRFQGIAPLGTDLDPMRLALDSILVIIALVGGRIVPAFTRNAIKPHPVRANNRLDQIGLGALLVLALLHLIPGVETVAAAVAIVAGVLNAARVVGWGTKHTLSNPLLWILHASWLWLCVALVLQGLAGLTELSSFVAIHALTAGAIGNFTLGMMARVTLGHTGRKLEAHKVTVAAFVVMNVAALLRTVGVMLSGASATTLLVQVAGSLFALAFLMYLAIHLPFLLQPRPDGKP